MNVKCPECLKETPFAGNPHRPFCSERCRLLDLGEWAQGKHAIPAEDQQPPTDDQLVKKSEESE